MIQAVNQSLMIRFVARTIRFIDVRGASARPSQALPPLSGGACRNAPGTHRNGKIFFAPQRQQH
jgi:hypothetical protein